MDYLKKYGMQDCTPVCFTGDEGELRLELYVDRETGHGCGLKYGETKEGTVLAFEIDGYQNDDIYSFKNYPNPYSVDVTESYAILETHSIPSYLKQEYDYYDEDFEYRLGGGLRSYTLKGVMENRDGSFKQDEIYKVLFDYREQGTLWKKEYWYNEELFSTNGVRSQYYIYDALERLQYVGLGYDESPAEEYYLCYEGDSMTSLPYITIKREVGCGYLEYPKEYSSFMRGFVFKGYVKVDCSRTDPYAVYAEYGWDDSVSVHNWSLEEFQKDQSGFYCDYDDKGRILRTLVTGTRDIERFYIYEGDNKLPSYCFNMVYGSSSGVTLFEFD